MGGIWKTFGEFSLLLRRSAVLCVKSGCPHHQGLVVSESSSPASPPQRSASWYQPRIWHISLLVLFVAVAIVQIQDQRVQEPFLIALAAGGFVLYGLIGWLGWWVARRRYGSRVRPAWLFGIFAIAMGAFFLAATALYLVIEHIYRNGWS